MARKVEQEKEEEESRARQQEEKTPVREEEKKPACHGGGHDVVEQGLPWFCPYLHNGKQSPRENSGKLNTLVKHEANHYQEDAQDVDAYTLAKAYFDIKEYDRAVHFLHGCNSKKAYFLYMYSRNLFRSKEVCLFQNQLWKWAP
ncbi:hypothetical protein STEG23_009721 [Scotinomys teguina]